MHFSIPDSVEFVHHASPRTSFTVKVSTTTSAKENQETGAFFNLLPTPTFIYLNHKIAQLLSFWPDASLLIAHFISPPRLTFTDGDDDDARLICICIKITHSYRLSLYVFCRASTSTSMAPFTRVCVLSSCIHFTSNSSKHSPSSSCHHFPAKGSSCSMQFNWRSGDPVWSDTFN